MNPFDDLLTLFELGGPVVYILLVMSVIGLALVMYKLITFRHFSRSIFVKVDEILEEFRSTNNAPSMTEQLQNVPGPIPELLLLGVRLRANDENEEEQVREELIRKGNSIMLQVNSMLRLLDQIAYLSPLLGLLGTVLGIIGVFQGLASAGGAAADTGSMAGGIWEALLTTAIGISIAIPFALISAILENKVTTIQGRMQDQLTRLFTLNLRY